MHSKQKLSWVSLKLVFSSIYDLIKQYRRYFIVAFAVIILQQLIDLAANYTFKEIIDALISQPGQVIKQVFEWGGLWALCYFAISGLEYFNSRWIVKVEIKIGYYLALRVYQKLIGLSLGYHEKENTGAKLTKIDNGCESVRRIIDRILWDFGPTVLKVIFSFVFLMFIDWRVAFTFLIIIPVFFWLTLKMNASVYGLRRTIRSKNEKVYGKFGQAIYNVKTVQAYVQEEREMNESKKGFWSLIRTQFRYIKILFSYNFWRYNIVGVGMALVIGLGLYLASLKEITPGELVLFINISFSTYFQLYALTRIFDDIMEAKVGVERILKILNSDAEIGDSENAKKIDIKGFIEFKNVYFDYDGEKVLHGINFKIKPGEVVAIVGHSGGGKTTLAKLLYRYFDVKKGQILIDGIDLRELDLNKYRSQLGIVSQDIDIFNDTVKSNIAYGKPHTSLKKIIEASKVANAHEFIQNLKKKYDTVVGERGVKLSGGQRQRVGIARAILIEPKILVLDEATSSLDAESEKLIQHAIKQVIRNRTTIIIAHRLSTVKNADRIIVLDKGRIIEVGTHAQLIRKRGAYAKLVNLQISGYLS
ncbi:MAG: ABC transporter related protein [Parcubacteria group bacterium GW2011_GWC2_39_14]|nr:MAG: ABC transporter related protein [Parcubacteria group bacterium GW2011_GWC2_39_14]KKR54871.1 MAG: ABC transporter related protein [Parcubacteria group bacterium GW2011_GWA2_40_23]